MLSGQRLGAGVAGGTGGGGTGAAPQGGGGGERATAGSNAYGGAQTETTAGVATDASSLGGDR